MGSRTRWAALVAVAAAIVVPVAAVSPAAAHNFLVASNPAADSTVTALPDRFSVTTDQALLDLSGQGNGFAIQVRDAAGRYYGDGCPVVEGSSLYMGATLGEPGPYSFAWQLVSADGHTVSGEFAFTWAPADPAQISAGLDAPPVCGATQGAPEPEPTVTAEAAEPSPTPSAATGAEAPATASTDLSTALWIGGAVLAVLVAAGATALLVRRR